MKSRKPDYKVAALNKQTESRGNIGAAWVNEDRTISLILEPFVNLQQDGNLLITLFPNEKK